MTKEEKELRACYHWTEWERKAKDLETENNKLLDVINNQDVKIADLEQQIEKMKCCANCKHFNYKEVGTGNKDCILWQAHKIFCKNKDKWELRR